MGRDGASMGIYHTRPTPFNFLNGMGMVFVLNKWGGVGMGATRLEPAPLPSLLERQVHGLEPKVQTRQRPRQCKTYTDMVMGFLLLLGIGRVAILRKQLIGYLAIPLLLVHQIWMLQQVVLLLPMLDCLMEEVSFLYTLLLLFCFIHLHSFDDYHYMIMQLHVASIYSDFLDKVGSSIKPPRIWDIYISLRDSTVE